MFDYVFDVSKMGKSERAAYENWKEFQEIPDGEVLFTLDLNNPEQKELAEELSLLEIDENNIVVA